MPATVHLIDASPWIFRAWFSLPQSMLSPEGRPVGATRGFTDTLLALLASEGVTHAAVAFDESLTTSFRNEIHPGYKASRELPPPELEAQVADCQELCRALGLVVHSDARYEADDLLGALWLGLRAAGHPCVIVTTDKDLTQLVDDRTTLYDLSRGLRLGPAEVRAKLGVAPEQVADFLALAGDAVDDIPGVRGIGAKSAAALLQALGSLDEVYLRLDEVEALPVRGAAALRRKLEAGREAAALSRRLTGVATDCLAAVPAEELEWRGADEATLVPLLERLGLAGLRGRVPRFRD